MPLSFALWVVSIASALENVGSAEVTFSQFSSSYQICHHLSYTEVLRHTSVCSLASHSKKSLGYSLSMISDKLFPINMKFYWASDGTLNTDNINIHKILSIV